MLLHRCVSSSRAAPALAVGALLRRVRHRLPPRSLLSSLCVRNLCVATSTVIVSPRPNSSHHRREPPSPSSDRDLGRRRGPQDHSLRADNHWVQPQVVVRNPPRPRLVVASVGPWPHPTDCRRVLDRSPPTLDRRCSASPSTAAASMMPTIAALSDREPWPRTGGGRRRQAASSTAPKTAVRRRGGVPSLRWRPLRPRRSRSVTAGAHLRVPSRPRPSPAAASVASPRRPWAPCPRRWPSRPSPTVVHGRRGGGASSTAALRSLINSRRWRSIADAAAATAIAVPPPRRRLVATSR